MGDIRLIGRVCDEGEVNDDAVCGPVAVVAGGEIALFSFPWVRRGDGHENEGGPKAGLGQLLELMRDRGQETEGAARSRGE